jgi:hypothetical protein
MHRLSSVCKEHVCLAYCTLNVDKGEFEKLQPICGNLYAFSRHTPLLQLEY